MNLIEAERLIRRITEVLHHQPRSPQARQLAQDYAEMCREVNRRLEQCSTMLAQSEEQQALQLAEAPPPLLDLVTRLSFRHVADWRAFCQAHELPVAEPLEGKFIRQLSEAYGKGLAADHQLYRQYRQALLSHHGEQAVAILRTIARQNPADANAPRELDRLEHKIMQDRLGSLAQAIDQDDLPKILGLIKDIEGLNFHVAPSGEIWKRAQTIRCQHLIHQVRQCRTRQSWLEAEPWLAQIQILRSEYDLPLECAGIQDYNEAEAWITACQQTQLEERRFQRNLADLRQLLGLFEEKQIQGTPWKRLDLRDLHQQLERKWRELGQFGRPIEDAIIAQVAKTLKLLESLHARQTRRLHLAVLFLILVFLGSVTALCLSLVDQGRERRFINELTNLQANRNVFVLAQLVQHIESKDSSLTNRPALRMALAQAKISLDSEKTLSEDCQKELQQLNALADQQFAGRTPESLLPYWQSAHSNYQALSKDYQSGLQSSYQSFSRHWKSWLDQEHRQRDAEFQKLLTATSQFARDHLSYDRPPHEIRRSLGDMASNLTILAGTSIATIPELLPGAVLRAQYNTLTSQVSVFQHEVGQWTQAQGVLRNPTDLAAYLHVLFLMQTNEFSTPREKAAAAQIIALNLSTNAVWAQLLAGNQPGAWSQWQQQLVHPLKPSEVLSVENDRLARLRDDENIHNIKVFELAQINAATNNPGGTRRVYARNAPTRARIALRFDAAYDPFESPAALSFRVQEYPIIKYEHVERGVTREKAWLDRLGLDQLIDARSGTNYAMSLLVLLDRINDDGDANSVFRAFIAARLHQLMAVRPMEWGLQWAPSAAADRARLRELGADDIASGEWLVPSRLQVLSQRFDEHFAQARRVSYVKQAAFLNHLAVRALEAGMVMAGYVNLEEKPVLAIVPPPGMAELWGIEPRSRMPALLYRKSEPGQPWEKANPPLLFTPLWMIQCDRRTLLEQEAKKRGIPLQITPYRQALPPLFQGL